LTDCVIQYNIDDKYNDCQTCWYTTEMPLNYSNFIIKSVFFADDNYFMIWYLLPDFNYHIGYLEMFCKKAINLESVIDSLAYI